MVAILIQSTIAIRLAVTGKFEAVLKYIEFALVISLAATVFGLIWLRWQRPEIASRATFRCPGFPYVPLLFLALSAYVSVRAFERQRIESLWGLATLANGVVVYFLIRRWKPQEKNR